MLNLIREQHHQQPQNDRDHHELSPEQIQLIEQIFVAGLNASDYLLKVFTKHSQALAIGLGVCAP